MKKFYLYIAAILLLLFTGCGKNTEIPETPAKTASGSNDISSAEHIKELNENSNLGMELNQDSGLTEKEAAEYGFDYPYTISLEVEQPPFMIIRKMPYGVTKNLMSP